MIRTTVKKNIRAMLLISLAIGSLLARQIASGRSAEAVAQSEGMDAENASEIIFSNLGLSGNLYNSDSNEALEIAGKAAAGQTEEWFAVAFVPKVDARAKVL